MKQQRAVPRTNLIPKKELKHKDNMIQSLLTQLSKQTEFIQKQSYELQREV